MSRLFFLSFLGRPSSPPRGLSNHPRRFFTAALRIFSLLWSRQSCPFAIRHQIAGILEILRLFSDRIWFKPLFDPLVRFQKNLFPLEDENRPKMGTLNFWFECCAV